MSGPQVLAAEVAPAAVAGLLLLWKQWRLASVAWPSAGAESQTIKERGRGRGGRGGRGGREGKGREVKE